MRRLVLHLDFYFGECVDSRHQWGVVVCFIYNLIIGIFLFQDLTADEAPVVLIQDTLPRRALMMSKLFSLSFLCEQISFQGHTSWALFLYLFTIIFLVKFGLLLVELASLVTGSLASIYLLRGDDLIHNKILFNCT